jgi:hypothetical protein
VRSHLHRGPVAQPAVVHGKAIVMLGQHISRYGGNQSCQPEHPSARNSG